MTYDAIVMGPDLRVRIVVKSAADEVQIRKG